MVRLKLGVLGGTFDPVHLGHLILAEQACYQVELDRVIWVLTPHPPHKQDQPIAPCSQRLSLLTIALADNQTFEISRIDIDRQPPYYTLDTMRLLRKQCPEDRLFYLMGADSLEDLPGWYQPQAFIEQCDSLIIMPRPGISLCVERLDQQIPGIRNKVFVIDAPLFDISSTAIRHRIATGEPYRYFLPPAEYEYIRQNGLYLNGV
jgi:nicotinate-nucleotide adenylyltransferase